MASQLQVTVVSCRNLKDTKWISTQNPYVCIEYGLTRSSTRPCIGGGKNPTFQEKFMLSLVEGLPDLNIKVWISNTLRDDALICSGRVPLTEALSQGFDDSSWPLQTKTGRHAGEVQLTMHYSNANKPATSAPPTENAPPYAAPPPPPTSYPPSPYPSYPQNAGVYPPAPYPHQAAAPYPPHPYPPNPVPYGSHYPPAGFPYPGKYPPPPY